jgi:hypothetical protein
LSEVVRIAVQREIRLWRALLNGDYSIAATRIDLLPPAHRQSATRAKWFIQGDSQCDKASGQVRADNDLAASSRNSQERVADRGVNIGACALCGDDAAIVEHTVDAAGAIIEDAPAGTGRYRNLIGRGAKGEATIPNKKPSRPAPVPSVAEPPNTLTLSLELLPRMTLPLVMSAETMPVVKLASMLALHPQSRAQ